MSPSPHVGPLALGSKAPVFSLPDQSGKIHPFEEILGPHGCVLVFYPGDMTPGCTVQLCAIRDDWAKFEALGIQVFGVNHADASSHARFSEAYHFPFPLLIDQDRKVSKAYGALRQFLGFSLIRRAVVGIDSNGSILFYMYGMPKDSDILKAFPKKN